MLVEVEFVTVPLATFIDGKDKFVIDRFVIVAEVKVAFVPIKFVVFVVTKLEVEALVVLAFEVAKLEVTPNKVARLAFIEDRTFANKVPEVLRFVIEEVAANN